MGLAPQPRVSVVVPTYNYARTLKLCLASVREQSYPDIELIVVDDNSTDDSVAVARSYGAQVITTGVNIGAPAARNLGAERATGDILFFLDSDVALRPDAVANAVRLIRADPELGAVCGTYDHRPLIRDSLIEEYRALQLYAWWTGDVGYTSTVFTAIFAIRTPVWREIGGFNPALRHSENADYGHRLSQRYRILLTQEVEGSHDHDDKLGVLLSKFFHRARLHMPLYLSRPDFSGGPTNGPRGWASLIALALAPALAVPVLAGPVWALLPALLLVGFVAADLRMYGTVRRLAGAGFTAYFLAVHLLVNATVGLAAITGGVQWLFSRRFRHTYDVPAVANPKGAGA